VQSAAGIAGYQGWGSGEVGQDEDGGIGYEEQLAGFRFGAGGFPELDVVIGGPEVSRTSGGTARALTKPVWSARVATCSRRLVISRAQPAPPRRKGSRWAGSQTSFMTTRQFLRSIRSARLVAASSASLFKGGALAG